MAGDFEDELARVVNAILPEGREQTRADVAALVAAGVRSRGDLIATLLDRDAGTLRGVACWLIGRLAVEEGLPALVLALGDPAPGLRHTAAIAVGELASRGAVPADHGAVAALIHAMRTDADANAREVAALTLGAIKAPAAVEPLLAVLADPAQPAAVRGAAAEALPSVPDARVLPALIAALGDPAAELRFFAAFGLAQLGDASALPALEQLAACEDVIVPGWGSVRQEAQAAIDGMRGLSADDPGPP